MPSAYLQWRFHSGERVVARGPLVFISVWNICCVHSLEVHCRGASNEYPQYMFPWSNKKKIFF